MAVSLKNGFNDIYAPRWNNGWHIAVLVLVLVEYFGKKEIAL
jgi:hypothetical protein